MPKGGNEGNSRSSVNRPVFQAHVCQLAHSEALGQPTTSFLQISASFSENPERRWMKEAQIPSPSSLQAGLKNFVLIMPGFPMSFPFSGVKWFSPRESKIPLAP